MPLDPASESTIREAAPLPRADLAALLWGGSVTALVVALAAPWSGHASAFRLLFEWSSGGIAGSAILAAGGWLTVVTLLGPIPLSSASRLVRRCALPWMCVAAVISVAVLAWSDALPSRIHGEVMTLPAPRPMALWAGAQREVLRGLLLAPLVVCAALANVRPIASEPIEASRWMVSLAAALALPVWGAASERWGARLAEVLSIAVLLVASVPVARRSLLPVVLGVAGVAGVWILRGAR